MNDNKKFELNDDELKNVAGGYGVGDTVRCQGKMLNYCPSCGRLLMDYEATITGVRGMYDDGLTAYWATLNCCGKKTTIYESEIVG